MCQMIRRLFFVVLFFQLLELGKFEEIVNIGGNNGKTINVVLFLSKTTSTETYNDDEGIRLLHFIEKAQVQHTIRERCNEDDITQYISHRSNCKQLLRVSLYSLISYCRNVLGMTTAIASVEEDSFSNSLRFRKSASEDLEIQYHHPRNKRSRKFYDPYRSGNYNPNQVKEKPHFITAPEHIEVFKIRSKRQNAIMGLNEETPSVPESPPKLGLLGVLNGGIKLTFFGNLLNDQQEQLPQQGPIHGGNLGKSRDENSLFELVKESLCSVQESCHSGFLLIVIGGCLKQISDPYSDLIQSIKHITENTDEDKTLIVVTGSCPTEDQESTNGPCSIPVFVKEPPVCRGISFGSQLHDVPYGIKNALSLYNSPGPYRKKRSIFDGSLFRRNSVSSLYLPFPGLNILTGVIVFKF